MPNAPWGPVNREGRNEFQVLISIMCVMSGVTQLATGNVSPALLNFTHAFQVLWASLLTLGGIFVLVSAAWKEATGLSPYLEVGGLTMLGGVTISYGIALFLVVDNPSASISAPLFVIVGLACLSRVARIVHVIWPRHVSHEEKIKNEVRKQMVEEAVRQADEIVEKKISADTGSIPIIIPDEPGRDAS